MATKTVATKKAGAAMTQDAAYAEFKEAFAGLVIKTAQQMSDNAYQLGRMCIDLQERQDVYGTRDLSGLAEEISEHTGVQISRSHLYDMKAFAEKVKPEQVKSLQQVGLPWRALRLLGKASLSEENRTALINDLVTGKASPGSVEREIRERVGAAGGGGSKSKEPYHQQLTAITNLPDQLTITVGKLRAYETAMTDIVEGDSEAAMLKAIDVFPKMQEAVDGACQVLSQMVDTLEKRLAKLAKELR